MSKADDRARRVAAERAAQAKRESRRRMLTIAGVAVAMVVIVGGAILVTVLTKKDVTVSDAGSSSYGVTIGKKDAPHTVVIYEDFICPFCGELESRTRDDLAKLAEDGKVQVEYRPFDLLSGRVGDYPIRAASAFSVVLEKSGPEVAKKFHDLLYENQPSEEAGDSVSNEDLVTLAVKAGATESEVKDPIVNVSNKDWVTKATAEAQSNNVSSTPTILLDGKVFDDGRTVDDLAKNLVDALE